MLKNATWAVRGKPSWSLAALLGVWTASWAAGAEPASEDEPGTDTDAVESLPAADAREKPGETYLFVGARYRVVMLPQFIVGLFAEGGRTVWAQTPGIEFAIRENDFEYNLFAQLGFYKMTGAEFKGKQDGPDAWEIIDADYKILYLGSDFMWSSAEFAPGLSLTYGAGLGLGLVFGGMRRTEAFPTGDPSRPYARCEGPRLGDTVYCEAGGQYNAAEPSWTNGGSSPVVFPWIAGNLGLRYKPHRNFVGRVELGIMPTGAFFGVGADYGI